MENSESEIEKSFQGQLDRMYEVMADSKRAAEQLRSESLSHKLEALPKFDPIEQGPLIPELEELCKINEQINKTNMEIGERLVAAGKTIDRLQMEIQEIKNSYKHGTLKQVLITVLGCVLSFALGRFLS